MLTRDITFHSRRCQIALLPNFLIGFVYESDIDLNDYNNHDKFTALVDHDGNVIIDGEFMDNTVEEEVCADFSDMNDVRKHISKFMLAQSFNEVSCN